VLDLADELGLLAVPGGYEDPGITDVGSTFVTLTDNAGTYEHDAYALGIPEETGNRKNLLDFVDALLDLEGLVGEANLGPAEPYVPALFHVTIVGSFYTEDSENAWPADVPVEEGCVELVVDRFADGVAGVYIAEIEGVETRVSVVPDLPGDSCT